MSYFLSTNCSLLSQLAIVTRSFKNFKLSVLKQLIKIVARECVDHLYFSSGLIWIHKYISSNPGKGNMLWLAWALPPGLGSVRYHLVMAAAQFRCVIVVSVYPTYLLRHFHAVKARVGKGGAATLEGSRGGSQEVSHYCVYCFLELNNSETHPDSRVWKWTLLLDGRSRKVTV